MNSKLELNRNFLSNIFFTINLFTNFHKIKSRTLILNKQILPELTTVRRLVDYVLLNSCSVNSSGLYNGKAGMALALFEVSSNENMQRSFIGGDIFYDQSGNFLGNFGPGDAFKVISDPEYNDLVQYGIDPNRTYGVSLADSSISRTVKTKVMLGYLSSLGITSVQIDPSYTWQAGFVPTPGGSGHVFTINSSGVCLQNESSLLSTLDHESYHIATNYVNSPTTEVEAIMQQVNSATYASTNDDYRRMVGDYLYDQYSTGSISGSAYPTINSIEDAYRICGVAGY